MTTPNYQQINALADMYEGEDFVILGFPCNQFYLQEPGANADEILNAIRYVRPGNNFESKVTQYFKKIDVNGADQIPLYAYLKETCGKTFTTFANKDMLFYEPLRVGDLYWNYEKFLIDRDGKPYTRYHPSVISVRAIAKDIDYLLDL
uniref:Glutathione peroxidase n=1 Tax=Hirondellea gigas TaxID=1518452 RepID=A0A2P2I174_9CRUS